MSLRAFTIDVFHYHKSSVAILDETVIARAAARSNLTRKVGIASSLPQA